MKKVYISGKITGTDDYKERFIKASDKISKRGDIPINPVEFCKDIPVESPWEIFMRRCVSKIPECDKIYLMRGWSDSRGAREEYAIAKMLGLGIEME